MSDVIRQLQLWHDAGWLRALDLNLAQSLVRLGYDDNIALMAALVSHQVGRGHTCLSLRQLAGHAGSLLELPPTDWRAPATAPGILAETAPVSAADLLAAQFGEPAELSQRWQSIALGSDAVQSSDQADDQLAPLVWDASQQLLYLRRYWQHEHHIQQWLHRRMQSSMPGPQPAVVRAVIDNIMPAGEAGQVSWQRIACANAVRNGFSVITGGPGTGKTYTVVRVLATLLNLHHSSPAVPAKPLSIALAAPTGKAAARMNESINSALQQTDANGQQPLAGIKPHIPGATTLHRLLGPVRHSRYFRHNRQLPLPYDVVVIDEASMIDTEMFDALLATLADHTRLILLGDKDQLAPVEAGSILSSLCRNAEQRGYSAEHANWLQSATGESLTADYTGAGGRLNHVVMLEGSRRFHGPIADLANAVNRGNSQQATAVFQHATTQNDARLTLLTQQHYPRLPAAQWPEFRQLVTAGFAEFLKAVQAFEHSTEHDDNTEQDNNGARVLQAFANFQLLCALREGPWGQRQLNQLISQWLGGKVDQWYHGRPVMVTRNDRSLNLNNGDIGIALRQPQTGLIKVVLAGATPGQVRWLLPSRLAYVETVYAMTVHKSQGSEFGHAVLVLPDRSAPVLTKELVYTGITRARQQFTLVMPAKQVWQDALSRRIDRLGGLFSPDPAAE